MSEKYYVTTPIYYVTDKPHIGHLYTTVAADIMAHYQRLCGKEVWFLTGTDEHGQKIQKKARENNETPQALADRVVERYRDAWKRYGIEYNDFIRTTEPRHKKVVQEYISRLMKTGDVYLSEYEGWYCVPDETYWTESQVVDGKCPDCGRPVEKLREESYFFKMSAYAERLKAHIEANPNFIVPESRKNEVLGFLQLGVRDISISRTTIQWGIPMPKDGKASKDHCVYVWFDALTNYLSALSPLEGGELEKKFWPVAHHIVGKDILRFHAVYWPTFLMALGLPLPKQIIAHGWLTEANRKISKSLGNVVDPLVLADEVGVDGMRYFLFREFVFGLDGEYTHDSMYQRINSDLANDYGNSINRVTAMAIKYLGTESIQVGDILKEGSNLKEISIAAVPAYHAELSQYTYHKALEAIWKIITEIGKYIEASQPWALAKSQEPADQKKLKTLLVHCQEALRISSLLLVPFIPTSAKKALAFLGDEESLKSPTALLEKTKWGAGPQTVQIKKSEPLFPRLEIKKEKA